MKKYLYDKLWEGGKNMNMNSKLALVLVGMLGLVMAIGPATNWTSGTTYGPYNNGVSTTIDVTGGHIYSGTLDASSSTTKWAAVFGDVTGTLYLSDDSASNIFHQWTWADTNGGSVCLSQGAPITWASLTDATPAAIDGANSFDTNDIDSATQTYATDSTTATLTVAGKTLNNGITPNGAGAGASPQSTFFATDGTSYLYCTGISADMDVMGGTDNADFEAMVPTPQDGSSRTYNIYVELA